jgi:hypothetical protein
MAKPTADKITMISVDCIRIVAENTIWTVGRLLDGFQDGHGDWPRNVIWLALYVGDDPIE